MKYGGRPGGGDGPDPLLGEGHFNYTNRPRRDVFWGILFVVFLVVTYAGGLFGVFRRCGAVFGIAVENKGYARNSSGL